LKKKRELETLFFNRIEITHLKMLLGKRCEKNYFSLEKANFVFKENLLEIRRLNGTQVVKN